MVFGVYESDKKKDTRGGFIYRLQISPYFCVFKYARAGKQKVWNEAENRDRDWGETLKILASARALRAHKTLTPRFTDFFTDFEKKTDCFAVYVSKCTFFSSASSVPWPWLQSSAMFLCRRCENNAALGSRHSTCQGKWVSNLVTLWLLSKWVGKVHFLLFTLFTLSYDVNIIVLFCHVSSVWV